MDNLSTIKIGWYLDIQAEDNGSSFVNASITVNDVFGNIIANGKSDSNGTLKWITGYDIEQNSTQRTYFSPYTINLSYLGDNISRLVWLDHSKRINITSDANETWSAVFVKLELESVVKPNLLNLTEDFPSGNFTTMDCAYDRYMSSFNNITKTYNPIISYIENKSGVSRLLNGSGIILAMLKHKDVVNLSSFNGVEQIVELNRSHMLSDNSFNLTNLANKIETINSSYNSLNITGVINASNLNITSQIENLTAIVKGLEYIPISDGSTKISLLHSDFECYLDSIQNYLDNMNTSTQYLTVCGMLVTKVNLDALYKYMGPSTVEMHSVIGGIREVLNGFESFDINTETVDDTPESLDDGNSNGVPFSMTYHYHGSLDPDTFFDFDLRQMVLMGMNWVRIDVNYEDICNLVPFPDKTLLDEFLWAIRNIRNKYDIDFRIFMVLKPVNEIERTNYNEARTRIVDMIDKINDYEIYEDVYLRDIIFAYQIMNEPPKKIWISAHVDWWSISTSTFTSFDWMKGVVVAAKDKISADEMTHPVTVNLAYPRYFILDSQPTTYYYLNGQLIWIQPIYDPIIEEVLGTSPDRIGVWYEEFWIPLAPYLDYLGVDIYPEDLIVTGGWTNTNTLEMFIRAILLATKVVGAFWISETPAIDRKYFYITTEDIYNYIKWEYESGAQAISIYQCRDSGDYSDLSGEKWAYGLFNGGSQKGHRYFIENIRKAAIAFGTPFLYVYIDQQQECGGQYIYFDEPDLVTQTFLSGREGSTSYVQVYMTIPSGVTVKVQLGAWDDQYCYYCGESSFTYDGEGCFSDWVLFEFLEINFPAYTDFIISFKVQGGGAYIESSDFNLYSNGELDKNYHTYPNLDAKFRTFVI